MSRRNIHPSDRERVLGSTPEALSEGVCQETPEEAYRASQRLAAIIESSDDAIVSKNLNGIITSWNRGAERIFGYSASEAIGQSITIIIPRDRLAEEDMVLSRIRAGQPVEIETVRRHKNGTPVDISLVVSPVKDLAGHIVGASKIARDISARKRGEAERAELHRRLTLLVTASASLLGSPEKDSVQTATLSLARQLFVADGYAIWMMRPGDPGWHIVKSDGLSTTFASRTITSHGGMPAPARTVSSGPLAIPDVAAEPMVEELLAACTDEGIRSMLVCPMRLGDAGDGTLVFYYRIPHAFSDEDVQAGQALANLAAAALTSAHLHHELRAQHDAAESARRKAAFLSDATAILSRSLDYEETLTSVARLAVPEIADWCVVDIFDSDGQLQRLAVEHVDAAKVECARLIEERYPAIPETPGGVYEVIRTGQPAMVANIPPEFIAARARDHEHRRLLTELGMTSCICVPLISTSGTLGAITLVHAESGRHYNGQDLAFAQHLAARAALAIENVFVYRRVHEANRLKDEFLATLSHELRTPLNAILGYAQMLSMSVLQGERQSNAIAVLTRNAESLKQIIDDVLDVSRITSGKLRLNVRSVDLSEILKSSAETIQPAADAKGVVLRTTIDEESHIASGDPDRLQQVVWNLLSNAVKFTPRGGHVHLNLERVDSSSRIVVSDDGQGIEPHFLPHIFERFRQADSRFSREHGGLGLGLAIVRDIVELHGGTASAASPGPGRGATFTIQLPPVVRHGEAPRHEDIRPLMYAVSKGLPDERLKGLRILAVDDEEDALGLLRVILESAGADVTTAGSAQRALDLLPGSSYDAVVADIGMPKMDGLELIRRVRQTLPPPSNRIPAAALTAYARSEDRLTALVSGFQMHIPKPINPTELVSAVGALLGR